NDGYIRKSLTYVLSFTDRIYTSMGGQTKRENVLKVHNIVETQDGFEYCFTVPSGMLVLRRNDKIFITGNCGKSTTMLEYVKSKPEEKILFLVYNKEMQQDFEKRANSVRHNCQISTIHSIAYRWYMRQGYPKKAFRNISMIDIKNYFKNKRLQYDEITKIKFYFDMFLCSDSDTPFSVKLLRPHDKVYLSYVNVLWQHYTSSSETMPHNVYLKLFQLSKPKLDFETIIFDEFNDVNGVMIDIVINNLDKKVMVVGDQYQNLNSFNHTISGLELLVQKYGFKQYGLTKSFRVSEEVAKLSSRYLTYMYDKDLAFNGLKDTKLDKLKLQDATKDNQIALLCRTRLGGLKEISFLLDVAPEKKIYYVGGLDSFGIKEIEKVISYNGTCYIGGEKFHVNTLRQMIAKGLQDPEA
ncbi:MAG: hypothetical protein ACRCRT_05920, partial [Cetobacterium somerae]